MLYGHIEERETYRHLVQHPVWKQAFEWVATNAPKRPSFGIHPIIGESMYANVMEYETVQRTGARYESHRKYIDLQYTITGSELIEWSLARTLKPDGGYEEAKDLQFYLPSDSRSVVHMQPGHFGIFFPQDAHMPKLSDGKEGSVYKLVVKIGRALLEK
jgi:YhcH/YjgK/YiaL family protein